MPAVDTRRAKIVQFATRQTQLGVDSSAAEAPDATGRRPRQGAEHLLQYFHLAAPGQWPDDVVKYSDRRGLPDWCGIFALWAIKSAGLPVGTWRRGLGISSVRHMKSTQSPQPGDIGFKEYVAGRKVQHMNLIASVTTGGLFTTIDGNNSGTITGPSAPKSRGHFDSFWTAFSPQTVPPTPVGRWEVHVGVWTWNYVFYANKTVDWRDIVHPHVARGTGSWRIDNVLRISWPSTGAQEEWDLPLNPEAQTGNLIGQGPIITARRLR